MSKFEKHERGDRIKWIIIFTVVAALIVGFFAIVTKGFKQNDPKTWFSGNSVETVAVRNGGTVEASTGAKLATSEIDVPFNSSLDRVTFDYTVSGYKVVPATYNNTSSMKFTLKDSAGNVQNKEYDVMDVNLSSTKTINLVTEFNLTVGETYTISAYHQWMIGGVGFGTGKTEETTFQYGANLPETPSKTGYTFAGWYYDEAFTRPYNGEFIFENTQFYAKFEAINYTITYNANGGTVDGSTSYNIETATYVLPTPTRTGYDFLGWYSSADFTGAPVTEIAQGSTGNVNVYAKWEIQIFKVSFYVDGELYLEMDVEYGTRLIDLYLVDTQTLEAVAFSLDAEMLTAYSPESLITNDMSLFASEKFAVYAGLTYNIDGVETMDLLDYNSTLSDLRTPTKDGYTFDGWYYDAEYTKAVQPTDKLTSNKTIYAKFTEIQPETFGDKVAKFFTDWWWCFAAGAAIIVVGTVVIIIQKKRGTRK